MSSNIRQRELLSLTENYVRKHFENEGSGHDWWHIFRVRNLARKLSQAEGGDVFLVEMAALLHDLDDWKLNTNKETSRTKDWLKKMEINSKDRDKVLEIIEQVSFKGANVLTEASSLEAQIVQDSDRLDAMGAIGIARTFAYGGNKGRLLYHPDINPEIHNDFESYKRSTAPTINHFYEKLLLLKDSLNTKTAKKLAKARHKYMKDYLEQFFLEWEAKK